jgi:hypothetical protein
MTTGSDLVPEKSQSLLTVSSMKQGHMETGCVFSYGPVAYQAPEPIVHEGGLLSGL